MAQPSRRNILLIVALVVLAILVIWYFGPGRQRVAAPTLSPTSEVQAAPTEPPADDQTDQPDDTSAASSAEADSGDASEDDAADNPDAEANEPDTAPEADEAAASTDTRRFMLDPAQSEARFIIDEILFGDPNTVVGSTNVISGVLTVDLGDLAQTSVEPVVIDASELATDNRFRNRSLSRMILQSNRDEYQYITFTPTQIDGLPASPTVGETANLAVTGDLQIRDIVAPATFAVTVTAASDVQLEGLAVATVHRADFDLQIPDVDGVAEVSDDVRLEFEFIALAEDATD